MNALQSFSAADYVKATLNVLSILGPFLRAKWGMFHWQGGVFGTPEPKAHLAVMWKKSRSRYPTRANSGWDSLANTLLNPASSSFPSFAFVSSASLRLSR
jgi:hypothetical protein